MKIDQPSRILQNLTNHPLPVLSTQDLTVLDESQNPFSASPCNEDPSSTPPTNIYKNVSSEPRTDTIPNTCNTASSNIAALQLVRQNHESWSQFSSSEEEKDIFRTPPIACIDKHTENTNVDFKFAVPKTPANLTRISTRNGSFSGLTPYLGSRSRSQPSTPVFGQSGVIFSPMLNKFPKTPNLGNTMVNIPVTPQLYNLCSTSPCMRNFSLDLLATPTLFPATSDFGMLDLLSIIDNDENTTETVQKKIDTFETQNLCDESVTDYILDIADDYTKIQPITKPRKSSVIEIPSSRALLKKGRRGKRLMKELEDILKEERKAKAREKRMEKSKRLKEFNSKGENDVNVLKRKVKRCGRRTRSLVQACKEMGLASSDADIDAIFTSSRRELHASSQQEE